MKSWPSSTFAYVRVAAGAIALAGLLLSIAVHGLALHGIDVETAWPGVWVLHWAAIPMVVVTVLVVSAIAGKPRPGMRALLGMVPWPARIVLVAALIYTVATFVIVVPSSGAGVPMIRDGRYSFNDHGTVREVSEDEFHAQRSRLLRLYSGVWLYLYLFSVIYLLAARRPSD